MVDALETIGTKLEKRHAQPNGDVLQRDAIHVAVVLAVASENLMSGQDVGIDVFGHAGSNIEPYVGVVDPFLVDSVSTGEAFWLCMYPRSITGLKHEWSHPALDEHPRLEAEEWLHQWFGALDTFVSFDEFIARARQRAEEQEVVGSSLSFDDDIYGEIPNEVWDNLEIYLERPIPQSNRAEYFSCSC